jgi:hypothetical protein
MKMAPGQREVFHLSQQTGAEIFSAQVFIYRHTFDDIGGQARTTHQPESRPGFNESGDIVVHA